MTLPIGFITQRWGGKLPLQISLFINGIASIVTPWFALWVRDFNFIYLILLSFVSLLTSMDTQYFLYINKILPNNEVPLNMLNYKALCANWLSREVAETHLNVLSN